MLVEDVLSNINQKNVPYKIINTKFFPSCLKTRKFTTGFN